VSLKVYKSVPAMVSVKPAIPEYPYPANPAPSSTKVSGRPFTRFFENLLNLPSSEKGNLSISF
jgi:hypothetical protein